MRSVPQALIWEMLVHGRWSLLIGVLAANALPLFLFTALSRTGPIDSSDPSYVVMFVMLTQIHVFVVGSAVVSAQGQPARLYSAPILNSTLATWHMLPTMLLVAVELILSTMLLNSLFHFNWPLWGPALFVAAATAAILATIWQTDKSVWLIPVMGIVAGVLGVWFKSRFGPIFSLPQHLWTEITPVEVVTLALITAASYYAALGGIARRRRGDVLQSPRVLAWIKTLFDLPSRSDRSFRTASEAQFWFEWRQKGWLMPATAAIGLTIGLGIWTVAIREPHHLLEGFLSGGGLLSLFAFVTSMIVGNTDHSDSDFAMSQFLASRPITNRRLSQILLQVIWRSVLLTWLIWAVPFLMFYLISLTAGITLTPTIPRHLLWLYFPATLFGVWTLTTFGATLCLTGRRWMFVGVIVGGLALFITGNLCFAYLVKPDEQPRMGRLLADLIGAGVVLGTAWSLIVAKKRDLISWPAIYGASSVWIVLSTFIVGFQQNVSGNLPPLLLMLGALALGVAPVATAPLALAWNRNR